MFYLLGVSLLDLTEGFDTDDRLDQLLLFMFHRKIVILSEKRRSLFRKIERGTGNLKIRLVVTRLRSGP